eukprot:CAMPEP_0177620828 /NCGR_PEP_ID=MMETSP0419_2-20121207/27168_1 /TAXON_ID=582737 /ORGANISM="Tetraselmis sp., Strain GSL018" /LENGTH=319 /DNA_ID=CAMNT_0019120521 /DNA_START=177 /DNA_END=1136 /DNA_ORIENTATION=+
MAITGRVLGHSGILKGLLSNDRSIWRPLFVAGMAGGAIAASNLLPGSLVQLPETFSIPRAVSAGLLVGVGSTWGNGCTSGHGICGNARLSVRSMVYTATFMVSGAVSATFSGVTEALGVSGMQTVLKPAMPPPEVLSQGLTLLGLAAAGGLALWFAASRLQGAANRAVNLVAEAATGAMFAAGLAYAGMTKSSKVGSFLAVTDKCWDPTLMFVMCGALLLTMPAFQLIMRKKVFPSKPVAADAYQMPTLSSIDVKLILGGILFGAGWGVGGMCPGPAIANLAAFPLNPIYQSFMLAMIGGMWLAGTSQAQGLFEKQAQA